MDRRATRLEATLANELAWTTTWETIVSFTSGRGGGSPDSAYLYARQVMEHGIAARVHQVGQELMVQVHAAGVRPAEQIVAVRTAMQQLTANGGPGRRGAPVVLQPVVIRLESVTTWQWHRLESEVMLSLVAYPEQLTRSQAAILKPRDMRKPEHRYLLAAVIDQYRLGLDMDPFHLAHKVWASAAGDGVQLNVGYVVQLALTAQHHEAPDVRPHLPELPRLAQEKAPVVVALSVQRHTAKAVSHTVSRLAEGTAPRRAADMLRTRLAALLQQAQRYPHAIAPPLPC
ncbi:hypothetical protein GCM10010245_89540 [Streptomyces spectabilis]|uniref:Uncharacterized protein n=1 Tax=Streptomyces spectabilis TaxID=68270 RepID=A0A7W8EZH8_STRST|nr:hypothetical protein [Streptomyces spectabilis]MBB5109916.1 hypothetical protein [Streptomyces spectabilis]GGV56556.1 hypothetical protein GCM10010245_89540 [Streptomyces spectabilis]